MFRFLKIVIFILLAIILLGFAFANHHDVIVSFDPFAAIDNAALSYPIPLFVVVVGPAILQIATLVPTVSGGR